MSKKVSPTLIGLFTLTGLLIAGGALVLFGAGKIFENTSTIMLYFDKSANGLLVGSEVRFGGVRIGRVTSIKVLVDQNRNRKIIPVTVQLSEKDLADIGTTAGGSIDFVTREGVQKAVNDGLRARMKQQSLLTGQLYVEFDIVPNSPATTFEPEIKSPYPVVPTMGTEMDELISDVADSLKKITALDLAGLSKDLRELVVVTKNQIAAFDVKGLSDDLGIITDDVRAFTGNDKLPRALDHLEATLKELSEISVKANKGINPLLKDLEKVLTEASNGLAQVKVAAGDISGISNPRAPVLVKVQNLMEEVERAARAVKELANDLKRNPNSLLFGNDTKP